VYCQASGFGLHGPDAQRPALDPLAQARGGLMSVTGEPDAPPTRTFTGMADQTSAFLLALGVMVALFHRERTGDGQMVDGSLLQSMLGAQSFNIGSYMMSGTYGGSPIPRLARGLTSPLWNHYRGKDGRWLMLAMSQLGRYWAPFREVMEEATGDDIKPKEMTLDWIRGNAGELVALVKQLDAMFLRKTAREWMDLFREHDMIAEIAQDYRDVQNDPQVVANAMLTSIPHEVFGELKFVATPVNLSATPGRIRTPAPEFGQHTEEVLLEAGYSWEEIGALREWLMIALRAIVKSQVERASLLRRVSDLA
jgi:crotonobetainyl-CoA:carnitine CoA-transferase CaiB-like acyl-CoA transferase